MFNFEEKTAGIEGWLSQNEGAFLYESAKKTPRGTAIIEVGSWKGRSTVCLAQGSIDGTGEKVYAIDPHVGSSEHQKLGVSVDTYAEFLKNIDRAGVRAQIEPIRSSSTEASKTFSRPVGFAFIDGAHEYGLVRLDEQAWFPKIVDGGTIAFHDSRIFYFVGPVFVTAFTLLTSSRVRRPRLVDTITSFEKVAKNSLAERAENCRFVLWRTSIAIKNEFITKTRRIVQKLSKVFLGK